jgi:putative tryptophan/tyrosine transport system substrate-binding protein
MDRRQFSIALLLVGLTKSAWAQRSIKVSRIAIVSPTPLEASSYRAFMEELRRLGYVEGKNLLVEPYWTERGALHDPELAQEVVRRSPDVILAVSNPFVQDFKAATTTIPIVGFTADPVALGIVSSIAHPGGNITGISIDAGIEIWGKRLEILRELTGVSRIGFLASPIAWDRYVPAMREVAGRVAVSIAGPPLQAPFDDAEYRRVLAAMRENGVQALIVSDLPANLSHRELIVELADRSQWPAIYPNREFVEIGGLIAYGFDLADTFRHGADHIDQILKGRKPSDIPYFQLNKWALIINLKTVKALGLTVPPELLARADEVIE